MSGYVNTPPAPQPSEAALPLDGLRVLVTRPAEQAADLLDRLRTLGAVPVLCPTIQIAPPASYAPLDRAMAGLAAYDWVIFTSVNGVRFFMERLAALGHAPADLSSPHIAAIGPATAHALADHGLTVSLVPRRYVAEAILDEIGDVAGQRILLPRADIARKALAAGLQARGAEVDEVAAYRTVAAAGTDLPGGHVDIATFTSPSTVHNLVALFDAAGRSLPEYLAGATVACIGPITAQAAREEGLDVDIEAQEHTVDGLLRAILANQERGS
jgi:uroporphyrinogen-III synthase